MVSGKQQRISRNRPCASYPFFSSVSLERMELEKSSASSKGHKPCQWQYDPVSRSPTSAGQVSVLLFGRPCHSRKDGLHESAHCCWALCKQKQTKFTIPSFSNAKWHYIYYARLCCYVFPNQTKLSPQKNVLGKANKPKYLSNLQTHASPLALSLLCLSQWVPMRLLLLLHPHQWPESKSTLNCPWG